MSRGFNFRSLPGIQVFGNAQQISNMGLFIDTVGHKHCEDNIEKSAAELESLMKQMIQTNACGLKENGDLTFSLKGAKPPLVDSNQMVNAITWEKITKNHTFEGTTYPVSSCFIGILRTAGIKGPSSHLGKYVPISIYTQARNQVRGYTVTLPMNKVKKVVPKRDFREKPMEAYKEQYQENMRDAVVKTIKQLGSPL